MSIPKHSITNDHGDGKSNALVQSCPQFRNEIGDELNYEIATTRPEVSPIKSSHKPVVNGSRAASVLEDVPKPQIGFLIECPNFGQQYYRRYFANEDHRKCHEINLVLKIFHEGATFFIDVDLKYGLKNSEGGQNFK